ncbi:MAG: hypothetical protein KF837_28875 [Labilithrix sp.]|nr:hypothetical protein [Labilithrix sp.]
MFRLKYTPSMMSSFKEMPALEWKEVITLLDHAKGEYWVYIGDQYRRCISSPTFATWTYRYIMAYESTKKGIAYDELQAPTILYDRNGRQVSKDALPTLNSSPEKAKAVRDYLKRNGGMMDCTVRDSPGIQTPKVGDDTDKERLLTFDCGLAGTGRRIYCWQYLKVSSATPQGAWVRQFQWNNGSPGLKMTGLKRVQPPANVSVVKPGGLGAGQYE